MNSQNPKDNSADHEGFVRLLMQHDRTIRAFLRSMLPSGHDVDEVMQEVSVVAWRKFDQLDDAENFRRWVCVIARYEVLMYRRTKARDRLFLGEEIEQLIANEGLEELDQRESQLEALEACLKKLPTERRQLTIRVYESAQPMKYIAEQIGKTPEALYKLLSRTRRELLQCIQRSISEGQVR